MLHNIVEPSLSTVAFCPAKVLTLDAVFWNHCCWKFCFDPCILPPSSRYPTNQHLKQKRCRGLGAPLSLRQKALLARDITRGLHHLHQNGVLHLDLKAANVLLASKLEDGQGEAPGAVLGDMGMALLMEPGQPFAMQNGWR
jgi:serine/threonine protein kinase